MKDNSIIIMYIFIIVLIVFCSIFEEKHDNSAWNEGYCSICGDKWEYQDMYHTKNGGNHYIYCDKHGHTIELHRNYGK